MVFTFVYTVLITMKNPTYTQLQLHTTQEKKDLA